MSILSSNIQSFFSVFLKTSFYLIGICIDLLTVHSQNIVSALSILWNHNPQRAQRLSIPVYSTLPLSYLYRKKIAMKPESSSPRRDSLSSNKSSSSSAKEVKNKYTIDYSSSLPTSQQRLSLYMNSSSQSWDRIKKDQQQIISDQSLPSSSLLNNMNGRDTNISKKRAIVYPHSYEYIHRTTCIILQKVLFSHLFITMQSQRSNQRNRSLVPPKFNLCSLRISFYQSTLFIDFLRNNMIFVLFINNTQQYNNKQLIIRSLFFWILFVYHEQIWTNYLILSIALIIHQIVQVLDCIQMLFK